MNSHVRRFYRKFVDEDIPIRLLHDVIDLQENPELTFEEVDKKVPSLPKGWFELSRLSKNDRVEFVRDFWLDTLPYVPHVDSFIHQFFSGLDDVGVFITQLRFDSPYESEIVYSLMNGSCFFHGSPPCSEEQIAYLNNKFDEILPEDYLAFLKIHDGFSKHTDSGLIHSRNIEKVHHELQYRLMEKSLSVICHGKPVDPNDLIPFYESFGQSCYQCFYAEWNPGNKVGNVYYSPVERTISDFQNSKEWMENLAFPSFSDWLIFYLEGVEF